MKRLLLLSLSAIGGCASVMVPCPSGELKADHILVEYQGGSSIGQTPPADVHSTASFDGARGSIHTVALRFPDDCLTEGAARATGTATDSTDIMGTHCGVWLAELERALTDASYKVISWSALRQEQETKNISTYDAGVALGADVVLVVNSMETHTIKRGSSVGATYRYFSSNARGDKLDKLALPDSDRGELKAFIAKC